MVPLAPSFKRVKLKPSNWDLDEAVICTKLCGHEALSNFVAA